MSGIRISRQALVRSAIAAGTLAVSTVAVQAGGLAVREQSTSSQGASFAGSAAGGDLSSMFWNPAAAGIAPWGFYTESHYALIVPNADISGTSVGSPAFPDSADIGNLAVVPASYAAYRLNKDLVLALSINSPIGLATKPDPFVWEGSPIGQTSRLFTANVTPTLSYQIAPGLFVGAGVQLEYMKLVFKFGTNTFTAIADIEDDLGVGFTAGVLWQPSKATSIGLGFRSSITHSMEGNLSIPIAQAGFFNGPVGAKFENPEVVTLSVRQAVSSNMRLLGTVEWTNWSRFGVIPITGTGALGGLSLPGNWHDSWLFSGGLEYDVNQKLTLRTGVAFEKSPIQNATERLIQVPDSDRWWVSGGLTYRINEKMAMDFAYTHIFFDDAPINRTSLLGAPTFTGSADQSADIISVSIKNKW